MFKKLYQHQLLISISIIYLLVGFFTLSLITTHKDKLKAIPFIGDYANNKFLQYKEMIIIIIIALAQLIL